MLSMFSNTNQANPAATSLHHSYNHTQTTSNTCTDQNTQPSVHDMCSNTKQNVTKSGLKLGISNNVNPPHDDNMDLQIQNRGPKMSTVYNRNSRNNNLSSSSREITPYRQFIHLNSEHVNVDSMNPTPAAAAMAASDIDIQHGGRNLQLKLREQMAFQALQYARFTF